MDDNVRKLTFDTVEIGHTFMFIFKAISSECYQNLRTSRVHDERLSAFESLFFSRSNFPSLPPRSLNKNRLQDDSNKQTVNFESSLLALPMKVAKKKASSCEVAREKCRKEKVLLDDNEKHSTFYCFSISTLADLQFSLPPITPHNT